MAEDGRGWQRMADDGRGWQRMAEDGRGWQRMAGDGRGWQRMAEDGRGIGGVSTSSVTREFRSTAPFSFGLTDARIYRQGVDGAR